MPEYTSDSLAPTTYDSLTAPTTATDSTALPFWRWDTAGYTLNIDTGIPFDTLHRPREATDTVFRESMFQNHTLQVQHQELCVRPDSSTPVWTFATLLLLSGLIAIYYHLRKMGITDLLKALVSHRGMERLVRENNLNRNTVMLPMGMLAVAALCLPVHHVTMADTGLAGYLTLALGAGALYILRNALLRLLGNTFENKAGVSLYITNNYLYHLTLATVITVLLYVFYYLPGAERAMLYVIGGVVALAFVMRLVRGLKVFLTLPNSSSFYLFYYLCIVELIPILALTKWIIKSGSVS